MQHRVQTFRQISYVELHCVILVTHLERGMVGTKIDHIFRDEKAHGMNIGGVLFCERQREYRGLKRVKHARAQIGSGMQWSSTDLPILEDLVFLGCSSVTMELSGFGGPFKLPSNDYHEYDYGVFFTR